MNNSKTISVLSPDTVQKIAAGQVVERPASVVKELLENSIDAGATTIQILLESGGKKRIEVSDDGSGIEAEQLELACQPHTTSKISSADDIASIETFGFRGEALASIALVSDFCIQTKSIGASVGAELKINKGKHLKPRKMGMPTGTRVIVKHLFASVPGRKKFLKADATEFRKVLDVVIAAAIAHPSVGFFLKNNKKVVIDMAHGQTLDQRIQLLLGSGVLSQMIQVSGDISHKKEDQTIKFSWNGYLGKPQLSDSTKNNQFVIVNGRPVRDRKLASAVKKAMGSLIEPKLYPVFVLLFNFDPDQIDVNVHPRKETIELPDQVYPLIFEAVVDSIQQQNLVFQDTVDQGESGMWVRDSSMSKDLAHRMKSVVSPWQPMIKISDETQILQINDTYLAVATDKGLFLVDQHAAHERILYEQFLHQYQEQLGGGESMELATPVNLSLPLHQAVFLETQKEVLQNIGFEVEFGDGGTVKIHAIPTVLEGLPIDEIVTQVVGELDAELDISQSVHAIPRVVDRTLAYLACRSAIKAGDILSAEERRNLLQKLWKTTTQFTCPHGRPTQLELSTNQLEKLFHRK